MPMEDSFDDVPRRDKLNFRPATQQNFFQPAGFSETMASSRSAMQAFEPTFSSSRQALQWQAKPTKEGFMYFYIPGTNTF